MLATPLLEVMDRRGAWTVRRAAAKALLPDPELKVSEWAAKYRVIAGEEGAESGRWSNERAPYLTEIMDCLSPSHPCERVTVQKCAQTGLSQIATNFLFFVADQAPGPAMFIQATVDAAKDWVREKLMPAIEATPRAKKVFARQASRDEQGSTTRFKKFPGGYVLIAGANSAAALRQHTIRYMVKDDWDQWPPDVDGQGDPDKMADQRLTNFHNQGTAKVLQGSTPTIEGLSRAHAAYEVSDQRVYEVPCPHCGFRQELVWENLKFNKTAPYEARYLCAAEDCGVLIEHHHKTWMLAQGAWRATNPGPGREPGFRIYGVMSAFKSWDDLAHEHAECGGDRQKLKVFYNTSVGRPWREDGTAPPWHELMQRREAWKLRTVPAGVLIITCGVDVQGNQLRYQVIGWGVGKTSWSIDYGAILGDTGNTGLTGPWMELGRLLDRRYPDAFGRTRGIDMMAIDSGFNTQAVYDFLRPRNRRHRAIAVKGSGKPDAKLLGLPVRQEKTKGDRIKRYGIQSYPVGTWPLKSEFNGQLRLKPPEIENAPFPLGYCHFTLEHDEAFFKESTAEQLAVTTAKGKTTMAWVVKGENHYLDTRIYARAAAEHGQLRMSAMTIGDWQALIHRLEVPAAVTNPDLFSLALQRGAKPIQGLTLAPHDAAVPPNPHGAPPVTTTEDAPESEALPSQDGAAVDATQDAASRLGSETPPSGSSLDTLELPPGERAAPPERRIKVRPKPRW